MPALSLIMTVGVIMVGGYILNYFAAIEESNMERRFREGMKIPELKVHELRAESYNGLVRLLRPGCRTICLIVDRESKEKLVPKFFKMAWPYRRNKSLLFCFLYVERGEWIIRLLLDFVCLKCSFICLGRRWYEEMLQMTLPDQREIRVNPKNCVGTVLALNGHRKYFCMYHARHAETTSSGAKLTHVYFCALNFKGNFYFQDHSWALMMAKRTAKFVDEIQVTEVMSQLTMTTF